MSLKVRQAKKQLEEQTTNREQLVDTKVKEVKYQCYQELNVNKENSRKKIDMLSK